ncbi:MAG: glycosyltransferase, partial [Pseudomonadota bacterium]
QKYKDKNVHWAGTHFGDELAKRFAASDVFVFPSRTDTFGLVNVEALACGVPVAAYPVRGPIDILGEAPPETGCLDEDLKKAILTALERGDPEICRAHAENFSWEAGARQFIANLEIQGFDQEWWLRSAKMADDAILP